MRLKTFLNTPRKTEDAGSCQRSNDDNSIAQHIALHYTFLFVEKENMILLLAVCTGGNWHPSQWLLGVFTEGISADA